ncbi:MAG: hypothetical protein JHC57_14175 [Sphingopyxis sp.]|uniref:DUF7007 domain-containing protein n=1 Tax=Sphingopyxis sp. TaxID=1908224 RepID=UPI001A342EE7|nr:hypothetical protein [Sphingopyxis sp.]MBJ7500895.1 hypothetical protein [Sphingopyxis sp.]
MIEAHYGTTADGLLAARIDCLVYVAVPVKGGFRIATAYRPVRPLEEVTKDCAYGCEAVVADDAGFRSHIDGVLDDAREREALNRRQTDMAPWTPWGPSQSATRYAEGIICYTTAGHGGFILDPERNALVSPALRLPDGCYEEDCDWSRVAAAFPALFTAREKTAADKILRDSFPDAWEALYGRTLPPEESFTREREAFESRHAADWVVIVASRSDSHPGFIVASATLGGRRNAGPARTYFIPSDEYAAGRHGFVIDPARHQQPG